MIGISLRIQHQVDAGQIRIEEGQKKMDQSNRLFSIVPQGKIIGDQLSGSGQNKIAQGQQTIAEYTALAHKLLIGGIVVAILGAILVLSWKKKR